MHSILGPLEGKAGLRKHVRTAQMLRRGTLQSGVVVGGLVAAHAEVAEGQQVQGVGVARVEAVQAAGQEEGVVEQAIVEVVMDQLAQLGRDAGRRGLRGQHGGRRSVAGSR